MSAIQSGFATQPFFPMGLMMGALATSMTLMEIQAVRVKLLMEAEQNLEIKPQHQ